MPRTWISKVNDTEIELVLEKRSANPTLKAAVADLLREAADRFVLPRFQNLQSQDIATKTSDTDFVTIADQQAESWLAPKLSVLQPGFVIGEEAASLTPAIRDHIPLGYGWTIDPLDGTKNFVKGNQTFCSMVALLWNGQPVQSWIWQPLTQTLFYAADGQGAVRIDKNHASSLRLKDRSDDVDLMFGSGNSLGLIEPQKSSKMVGILGGAEGKSPHDSSILNSTTLSLDSCESTKTSGLRSGSIDSDISEFLSN